MSTNHTMYLETARHEIARRLLAADDERRRRVARHMLLASRRARATMWR